jgi:hypothetical protein
MYAMKLMKISIVNKGQENIMTNHYLGAILDKAAYMAAPNERKMFLCVDRFAESHLPFNDSAAYLKRVQISVQKEFGPQFDVTFFDPISQELCDEIYEHMPFQLYVILKPTTFYSIVEH